MGTKRAGMGVPDGAPKGRGAAAPGTPGAPGVPGKVKRKPHRIFSEDLKRRLVSEFERSTVTKSTFSRQHDLGFNVFCRWVKKYGSTPSSAASITNPRNTGGQGRGAYTPEERRLAVERFAAAEVPQGVFARLFGVSVRSLANWVGRYRKGGPKALETEKRGPKVGGASSKARLAEPLREVIVATQRAHPEFGLKKIRDQLKRVEGVRVSPGGIRSTLTHAGVKRETIVKRKVHRKRPMIRRFERATPNDLWQSDITTYTIPKSGGRFFLTVFLDDRSRFVVAYAIAHRQTSEFVLNCLLAGIAKFGKPNEVLTDQGRQYFAWRGKTEFQKLLHKEGIKHVVSRTHHPETLGKCERLWETIQTELFSRVCPTSFEDADERLRLWFAHYNFQRPHQGIDGMVPADRFFGAESDVRRVIEDAVEKNALRLALGQTPKRPVYLIGQIGDHKVSLHGEGGRLVVHGSDGRVSEMSMDAVGSSGTETPTMEPCHDNSRDAESTPKHNGNTCQTRPNWAETSEICDTTPGVPGAGALEVGNGSGATDGASDLHDDPRNVARESESIGGSEAS